MARTGQREADLKTLATMGYRKIRRRGMAAWLREIGYPLAVIAAGAVAIGCPILISLDLAKRQSYAEQMGRTSLIAKDVLRRADATADQFDVVTGELKAAGESDPCSDANVRRMGVLAITSKELQAVGHVAGDKFLCSSLGLFDSGSSIGPPDYVSPRQIEVRKAVAFPLVAGKTFMLVTDQLSGYTGIVDPNLVLDVVAEEPDVAMGLFAFPGLKSLIEQGAFQPEWMRAVPTGGEAEFSDGKYLITVRRSAKRDMVAYAAVPATAVDAGLHRAQLVVVPIGLIASAILAWCVLYFSRRRIALPALIKLGLRRGEFFMNYQPIVDLRTGKWVGAEALVRWQQSSGNVVRPDIFIAAAEEAGLITKITQRVLDLVAMDVGDLFQRYPHFHIAINLSSTDLHSRDTAQLVQNLIKQIGAQPHNISVEITERGFIQASLAEEVVRDLRASGIRVAIDDFGTGYSALAYLHTLELDSLKIDKSFVETIGTDSVTSQVMPHIINMSKDLRLDIIAEGVEHDIQAQYLVGKQVQFGQGHLFAQPMTIKELSSMLTLHTANELSA